MIIKSTEDTKIIHRHHPEIDEEFQNNIPREVPDEIASYLLKIFPDKFHESTEGEMETARIKNKVHKKMKAIKTQSSFEEIKTTEEKQ